MTDPRLFAQNDVMVAIVKLDIMSEIRLCQSMRI